MNSRRSPFAFWSGPISNDPVFAPVLPMRIIAAVVTLFSWCLQATPTFAQTPQDWALCLGQDLSSPDLPISGCTAIIQTGRQVVQRIATAYNNRGVAYRSKAQLGEAIDDFNEAIRLTPDFANAYNNRGVAYRISGNLDRALADFDQAIRLRPDYIAAFYNRAVALDIKGEHEKAISDFTVVLQVDPNNPNALFRRGAAYLGKGDIDLGNADQAAAKIIKPNIAEDFIRLAR